jgi:2-hydroxychromene-2-carboxylate isomerase
MTVAFYFDPECPWTWLTSRWLVREADREGFDISWRSLSLAYLNRDKEIPEHLREPIRASQVTHRMFEALRAHKENDKIGAFYEALGRASHSRGEPLSLEIVTVVAEEVGLGPDIRTAETDDSLDAAVAAQTEEALSLCNGDVGSPVLSVREGHGFNGPIIDRLPSVEEGQRLWEAVIGLSAVPAYFELKRTRTGSADTKGT